MLEQYQILINYGREDFFTWLTDRDYEITKRGGTLHCEIFEALKVCKFLRIGIS
jgi:hypothetical protein